MIFLLMALVSIAAIVDLRRREIPDWISVAILVLAVVESLSGAPPGAPSRLGAFLIAITLGYLLFRSGAWGGGDVKLLGALSAVLGVPALFTALYWMALSGAVLAIVATLRRQREFAYGPAIAFGALYAIPKGESWRMLASLVSA
jgi:prepilin peptidase CpaA